MIPADLSHTQATRAQLGEIQCLRNEEFKHWMDRLQPDVFTLAHLMTTEKIFQQTGVVLSPLGHNSFWYME
jgi:hypothetical protein